MSQNPDSPPPPVKSKSAPVRDNEEPTKSSQEEDNVSLSSQVKEHAIAATKSMKRVATRTKTGFFDWNPKYLLQMRGFMNLLHVILSFMVIILLGKACQLKPHPRNSSEGCYCKSLQPFLHGVLCGAFFGTVLHLFSCLLSKKTQRLLLETSFMLSSVAFILLRGSFQFQTDPRCTSQRFYCNTPEAFLLAASCGAFFTSVLYLFCCLLSKKTQRLLFETSFEVSYFILSFILLLTASVSLYISAMSTRGKRPRENFLMTQTASILGLLNSALYGLCSIMYFIDHVYYQESSEVNVNT